MGTKKKPKLFSGTETQLIGIFKKVISDDFPRRCVDHSNSIEGLKETIDNVDSMVKNLNKRLFVSNGEISVIEEQRNLKRDICDIRENLKESKVDRKYVLGLFVTILIALLGFGYGVYENHQLKNVVEIIKGK